MSKDQNNMNTKDFLIGALIGGVVGGMTALLFAPKSGKELREDLSTQSQTVKRKGGDLAIIAKEKSSSLAKAVSEQSSNVVGKVREWPETIRLKGNKEGGSSSNNAVNTIQLDTKPEADEDTEQE